MEARLSQIGGLACQKHLAHNRAPAGGSSKNVCRRGKFFPHSKRPSVQTWKYFVTSFRKILFSHSGGDSSSSAPPLSESASEDADEERDEHVYEGGDVGGTGQLVETTLFDRLEMTVPNPKTLFDIGQAEIKRLALISQQASNRAARCGFAFNHPPINLIWH